MLNVIELKAAIKDINNYIGEPEEYIFYYDETNNYKKIRIRDTGLNDNNAFFKNYVLGGICFLKTQESSINISELFNTKLKKYLNGEIKSSKLFKECKSFLDCLNKYQVSAILEWISNVCFIHYSSLNCLYYSIADVVDSLLTDIPNFPITREFLDIIKSDVYLLIFNYKEEFIKIANEINYPNIEEKNVSKFCDWLISLINRVNFNNQLSLNFIKKIIKDKKNSKSLIFLQGNENKTIVNEFYTLRQQRCIFFDNSYHIFDNETDDEKIMENIALTKDNITIFKNYKFKDSKTNRYIQISDIISSLLSRFFDFIDNTKPEIIKTMISSLNDVQKNNLKLLIEIINKSNKQEHALICTINSIDLKIHRDIMFENIYNQINS